MGSRLLLADDSITIQKVVAIIFANEEYELSVVGNGNAALEKAAEIVPDVMLVDALMPGKSGYEVCAEIRRDPKLGSVPILLLIGAFEPVDEAKAAECGADATISKPFESQQLIDRVKELLELGKSRRAAPAPAPRELPLEAAAEELWGDLSSFETMPPSAPAPSPEPFASFEEPAAPPAPPRQAAPKAPAPPEEEILEATLEDDLWGAFEMEEEPQVAAAATPGSFGVVEPEAEFEAEEFFSFEDESEGIEETGPPLELAYPEEEPVVSPAAEELFSLDEGEEPEPPRFPEFDSFAFEPEPSAPAAGQTETAWEAAAIEPQEAAPEAKLPAPPPSWSEAELAAAISRVSREVIERIVWEVVPDLAEALIKEEIRKLRAGIR